MNDGFIAPPPQRIGIEASKYCQLKCIKCPNGLGMNIGEKGFLSDTQFRLFLDQMPGFKGTITFSSWGEPFLNPRIFEIIALASGRGIRTTLSTNLCHSIDGFAVKIISAGLSKITVGLDGATAETYAKYRRGGNWKLIMDNIEMINTEKELQGKLFPELVWQVILTKYNETEIEKIKQLCDSKKMAFKIKPLKQDNIGEFSKDDIAPSPEIYDKYLPEFEPADRIAGGNIRCNEVWTRPSIDWDGEVYPCCMVYDKKYSLGNVFKEKFEVIWNSAKYRESRRLLTDPDYFSPYDLACNKCNYRNLSYDKDFLP